MSGGLTERNKQRTRRELAEAAARLFIDKGYASTTVQDIVDAADVSPRTFFRYFPCKEDVITAIASTTMDDAIDHLTGHDPSEVVGAALGAMLAEALAPVRQDPTGSRAFQVMLRDTPALRGRWLEEQRRSRDRLAEALQPWFGPDAHPLAAHLAAGMALLAVDEIMALWADDPSNPDPLDLLGQALGILDGPLLQASNWRPPAISSAESESRPPARPGAG
jgi:AcrR family transcriptional regulator